MTAKRPLKILVISSDYFPPKRVDVSVLFGEEIARRGHRIDWILQSEDDCDVERVEQWGGGQAWVGRTDNGTSLLARLRKHFLGLRHDLKLFGVLRRGGYDIIQVKDKFLSGLSAVVASRLYKVRFVYWLSWPFPEASLIEAREGIARYPLLYRIRGHAWAFILYKVLLRHADHVFVQSEQMKRDVAANGIPLERMSAVPMGIKPEAFAALTGPVGERLLIPEGQPSFLYLGILIKVRRLDFLVRVLVRVRAQVPGTKLYFVGRGEDPTDEELILNEARRLGLEREVILTGQKPQAQALRMAREADVCVSPFYPTPVLNSTSPTKMVEYMALEKAVVANDHPEQRLLIEASDCGICVSWDEQAFADAIVALLRDPERARQMGERGRAYAFAHRSYARIADDVELQLQRVAARER
jgi:glycosyltransferase involved in cell wall biosynthesis